MELGSDKERAVLAALAVDPGRPVSIEKLIVRLWDDMQPARARDNVHSYVSRIRRRLRSAGPDGPRIDGRAHTYVLRCPEEHVDWLRFQHMVSARPVEDDAAAVETLRRAESLWHGEPLAGLAGTWADSTRHAMLEQRLRATVLRLTATMRLGDFAGCISELSGLADELPADEAIQSLLMLAYHGSSRSAEALYVHQRLRQTLAVELGTRPGAEISRLHRGILAQIPAADLLRIPTTTGAAASEAATITPRNLPHQPPLVGRRTELRTLTEVDTTLADTSVISLETVTGMAGVGKTALAVHTANRLSARYPDAQLYLNLRAHAPGQAPLTATEALASLLRLLGAAADRIPTDIDEQTALWHHMLAERRVVIVLDDADRATQLLPLVPESASSLIIITSRRHLAGVPHARTIPLDVLPTPDAIALFRRFAGQDRTADLRLVRRVIQLCGHLPLAIELVATRFKARTAWTLGALADRLSQQPGRLSELRTEDKSVSRAFDLSYQSLNGEQRRAFRLLSLHPGSEFTTGAASAMMDIPLADAERLLEELLSCHLLTEPVADRFRYHDLLREYARSLAAGDQDRDQALHRMTTFYTDTTTAADQLAYPRRLRPTWYEHSGIAPGHFADAADAKTWLRAERENLLAAIDTARGAEGHDLAARLGYSLAGYLEADCYWQEAESVLHLAATHWRDHHPDAHSLARLALSAVQASTGKYAESAAGVQEVLGRAHGARDPRVEAEALRIDGMRRWHLGDHQDALSMFRQALSIQKEIGDPWEQARIMNNIAVTSLFLQRHDEAFGYFRTALDGFAATGDELASARILNNFGDMYLRKRDLEAARRSFADALSCLAGVGNRFDQATARAGLADTVREMGDTQTSLLYYEQSLQEFQSLGDRKSSAETLMGLAEAHRDLGNTQEALRHQNAALQLAMQIGAAQLIVETQLRLAAYCEDLAHTEQAVLHLEAASDVAAQHQDVDTVVAAQTALLRLQYTPVARSELHALLRAALASLSGLDAAHLGTVERKLFEYAETLTAVAEQ